MRSKTEAFGIVCQSDSPMTLNGWFFDRTLAEYLYEKNVEWHPGHIFALVVTLRDNVEDVRRGRTQNFKPTLRRPEILSALLDDGSHGKDETAEEILDHYGVKGRLRHRILHETPGRGTDRSLLLAKTARDLFDHDVSREDALTLLMACKFNKFVADGRRDPEGATQKEIDKIWS
jgi:hypothetical protein